MVVLFRGLGFLVLVVPVLTTVPIALALGDRLGLAFALGLLAAGLPLFLIGRRLNGPPPPTPSQPGRDTPSAAWKAIASLFETGAVEALRDLRFGELMKSKAQHSMFFIRIEGWAVLYVIAAGAVAGLYWIGGFG